MEHSQSALPLALFSQAKIILIKPFEKVRLLLYSHFTKKETEVRGIRYLVQDPIGSKENIYLHGYLSPPLPRCVCPLGWGCALNSWLQSPCSQQYWCYSAWGSICQILLLDLDSEDKILPSGVLAYPRSLFHRDYLRNFLIAFVLWKMIWTSSVVVVRQSILETGALGTYDSLVDRYIQWRGHSWLGQDCFSGCGVN